MQYRDVAPAAVQTADSIVALDGLLAAGALPVAVALDPVMRHRLRRLLRLDVRCDARSRRPLHAALVDRVLADCNTNSM